MILEVIIEFEFEFEIVLFEVKFNDTLKVNTNEEKDEEREFPGNIKFNIFTTDCDCDCDCEEELKKEYSRFDEIGDKDIEERSIEGLSIDHNAFPFLNSDFISILPVIFNFEEGLNFIIEPEEEIIVDDCDEDCEDCDWIFNFNKGDFDETITISNNLSQYRLSPDFEDFPFNNNLKTSPSFTSIKDLLVEEFTLNITPDKNEEEDDEDEEYCERNIRGSLQFDS